VSLLLLRKPVPFKLCQPDLMKRHHSHNKDTPTAYFHPSRIIRWLFHERLRQALLLTRYLEKRESCLDVGCGGGALFPSLSSGFRKVIALDRDIETAVRIRDELKLTNIRLVKGDLFTVDMHREFFDAIFALDVVEHLDNVGEAIYRFAQWLNHGGLLIICIPTENYIYRIGRKVFGFIRPSDHHFVQPMRPLLERYFRWTLCRYWPLPFSALAQFHLICGRK